MKETAKITEIFKKCFFSFRWLFFMTKNLYMCFIDKSEDVEGEKKEKTL